MIGEENLENPHTAVRSHEILPGNSLTPPFRHAGDLQAPKSFEKLEEEKQEEDTGGKPYVIGWRLHIITLV